MIIESVTVDKGYLEEALRPLGVNEFYLQLIGSGVANGVLFTKDVLARAAEDKVFAKGIPMHANHQDETNLAALVGALATDAVYVDLSDSVGVLCAIAKVKDAEAYSMIKFAVEEISTGGGSTPGVSIVASLDKYAYFGVHGGAPYTTVAQYMKPSDGTSVDFVLRPASEHGKVILSKQDRTEQVKTQTFFTGSVLNYEKGRNGMESKNNFDKIGDELKQVISGAFAPIANELKSVAADLASKKADSGGDAGEGSIPASKVMEAFQLLVDKGILPAEFGATLEPASFSIDRTIGAIEVFKAEKASIEPSLGGNVESFSKPQEVEIGFHRFYGSKRGGE